MRIPLMTFLLVVLATGLWQRAELSRLASREDLLRGEMARASGQAAPEDPGATATGKPAWSGANGSFDPAAYVDRLVELMARHPTGDGPPPEDETSFVLEELATASSRQLKELVTLLRESPLPEGLATSLFQVMAPRIAESAPEHAAMLAWEGGEWLPFRNVLRSWIAREPGAAAAWLEQAVAVPPGAGAAKFRALGSVELQALVLSSRLANDPGGEALDELLQLKGNPQFLALGELAGSLPPGTLAAVMNGISRHAGIPESERLQVIGSTLVRHQDPATARQILLDVRLSGDVFIKVAAHMIEAADPVGREACIRWVKALPDPQQRDDLLRLVEVRTSP